MILSHGELKKLLDKRILCSYTDSRFGWIDGMPAHLPWGIELKHRYNLLLHVDGDELTARVFKDNLIEALLDIIEDRE